MDSLDNILEESRRASAALLAYDDEAISRLLVNLSHAVEANAGALIEANAADLAAMDPADPNYDRLQLTVPRVGAIASDMRDVAALRSPRGRVLDRRVLENGLRISRVSVPFGVVAVVYEARPNVTFDVASLCLKSGNVCVLKGGKSALHTNEVAVEIIHRVLRDNGLSGHCVTLLSGGHDETAGLLQARGLVDLVIPRGGRGLIDMVRANAQVPVIETGAGVCHAYIHGDADVDKAAAIVNNAKTRRVSVCNALDCMLIDEAMLGRLHEITRQLSESGVTVNADTRSYEALKPYYPAHLLKKADAGSFGTEFLSMAMAIKTVGSVDEAVGHINRYGSGHSECIVTENESVAERFTMQVDAACVYTNAPTSWTDGAQFGLGAEIGISTQKLHARGPMALDALNTYKWIIRGDAQLRPS